MVKKPNKEKINIYETDTQGNTPAIGSAGAIDESERDGNHVVVISTEPLENVMARLEIKKQFEVAQNGMDPAAYPFRGILGHPHHAPSSAWRGAPPRPPMPKIFSEWIFSGTTF